jgi:hypothetical protein
MSRASFAATLILAVVVCTAGPASAQDNQTTGKVEATPSPPPSIITTAPNQTPSREVWLEQDLEEVKERIRRTRIALISTSAAFAVGAILTGVGFSQCTRVTGSTSAYYDDLVCNTAGDVLLPLGGTISFFGFVGVLTSGIMFGKARGRKREIERDIRRSQYGRRLQWDTPSGRLVF